MLRFSKQNIHKAREGLWRVINGEYRSGRKPEARFWEPGGDPNSIIKIDKPHLCDDSIWNLITDKSFGQFLGKETDAEYVQVWHSQVVWKPYSKNQKGMPDGIETPSIGHFGQKKVYIQHGLHYQM